MSVVSSVQSVLRRPDVWLGDRLAVQAKGTLTTGFASLDAELPGGGWPRGSLVELVTARGGSGELSLLLPALRQCASEAPCVLVAPPWLPHAPAWAAQLPLARLLVVQATGEDVAWSVEQLLASGALGALLAWLPAGRDNKVLRRLQLAAEQGRAPAFLFRPPACAGQASPAPLRLRLEGTADGLRVSVLKRRGPPCAQPLVLAVERPRAARPQPVAPPLAAPQLALVR